jgi:hypothetical protein
MWKLSALALALALAVGGTLGCETEGDVEEGMEETGEAVDETGEEVEDAVD